MNPWEAMLNILSWLFVILVGMGAAIMALAVLYWVSKLVQKLVSKTDTTRGEFERERQAIILTMSAADQIPVNRVEAFKAGAEWSRGFHTRKK